MRRMLVTGAAGFIGTNFVHFWAEHHRGDAIVGLDALTYAGNLANLEPLANNERFTFIKGDIRDGEAMHDIIKREGIDTIVHFAAESHVDRSIHGPDPFIDTNVRGTHELLKAARAAWTEDWSGGARRFHHISTDEVYGDLGYDGPIDPLGKLDPEMTGLLDVIVDSASRMNRLIDDFLDGFPSVSRDQVVSFLEMAKDRLIETAP